MADRLDFLIDSRPEQFLSDLDKIIKKSLRFDETLERLTGGQVQFNRAAQRFTDQSGRFVSAARVQELALERMGEAGEEAGEKVGRGASGAFGPMRQLGFVINDAQQFSYGLASGFRAISNNLGMLAMGLGASGGLVFLIEAAGTAVSVFGDALVEAFSEGTAEAVKAKEALEDAVDAFLKYEETRGRSIKDSEVPAAIKILEEQIERAEEAGEKIQQAADLSLGSARRLASGFAVTYNSAATFMTETRDEAEKNLELDKLYLENLKARNRELEATRRLRERLDELGIGQDEKEKLREGKIESPPVFGIPAPLVVGSEASFSQYLKDVKQRAERLRKLMIQPALPDSPTGFGEGRRDAEQSETFEQKQHRLRMERLDKFQDRSNTVFGNFADAAATAYELSGGKAKAFFALQKGFAIAQATIDTYAGANKALAQGGIFGPIAAASIIAFGLANVALIASMKPGGGAGRTSGGGISVPIRNTNGQVSSGSFSPPAPVQTRQVSGAAIGVIRGNDIILVQQRTARALARDGVIVR